MKNKLTFFLLTVIFMIPFNAICNEYSDGYLIPKKFIRAKGRNLVVGDKDERIILRGICFGNNVWSNNSTPPGSHHNESDFVNLKKMKFNVIRFYLNYRLFEDDTRPFIYKKSGFDWIDKNIAWAKKYGIYLILNIHVPQGGFQSNGDGMALWDNENNQKRLIALWKAIAGRYKDEPIIAGLDILNEPYTSKSIEQWIALSNIIVKEIRSVDKNHLVIVERVNGVKNDVSYLVRTNLFLINDPNIMYTFHYYYPFEYTHQFTSWTTFRNTDGGKYPDESRKENFNDPYLITIDNPLCKPGSSDWTYYKGKKFRITDKNIKSARPVLNSTNNPGIIYFDDLVVREYDENGNYTQDVINLNLDSKDEWEFYSQDNVGIARLTKNKIGHNDTSSLMIANTRGLGFFHSYDLRFKVRQNYSYEISGWMKGANLSAQSMCQFVLVFESCENGDVIVYKRNKTHLEAELKRFMNWGKENNVPLYVGEFGLYHICFGKKGGINWVKDMFDLLNKYELNFTYHTYHESAFGLYGTDDNNFLPGLPNRQLLDYFLGDWQ